jgi:hypothetical protein
LWEDYQSLSSSDTASQVELEALEKQIGNTMTSEQIKAIGAMELTEQSVSEAVQSLESSVNITMPDSTPDASTMSQSAPQGGGLGGMPGDGDSVMDEINSGTTAQSTPDTSQIASNSSSGQVDQMLLNVLIQLLKTRSQVTG